ncbi:MAG: hypothetical protein WC821_00195 [archaeon]|jgi:hypothetical protein
MPIRKIIRFLKVEKERHSPIRSHHLKEIKQNLERIKELKTDLARTNLSSSGRQSLTKTILEQNTKIRELQIKLRKKRAAQLKTKTLIYH